LKKKSCLTRGGLEIGEFGGEQGKFTLVNKKKGASLIFSVDHGPVATNNWEDRVEPKKSAELSFPKPPTLPKQEK